jgi:DNA helicase-2/ATP-dependent DNA helicase PcrA
VTAPLEPTVVVAGAGSGKTTVMAARVVWLVGTGQVAPDEVLGLTFTTKAAGELATRVRSALRAAGLLPPPGRVADGAAEVVEPTIATYNAYAASLLTEHGLRIGHEPDTRVVADASRYQLAARVVARYEGRVERLSDHPQTVIGYVLALDSAMSEHLVSPGQVRGLGERARQELLGVLPGSRAKRALEAALDCLDRREELLGLVEAYRRLKDALGLMEFSDQIELAARLALTQPGVGAEERRKHRVVLLDEYQDTSVAQALMLRRLFSGDDPAHGRGHPVTAVGDPNQAIYGWRGASVSNIVHFGEDFPTASGSAHVPSYPLTVNQRSDSRILEVANRLAAPLLEASPAVAPLEARPGAAPGSVRAEVLTTYGEELTWLAGQVRAAHTVTGGWDRIGVLTRDNAHAADVFRALSAADVPVEIVGLKGLLALPEVAEVVAILTLLHDLTANAALLTLLTGPRWAVGPRDLALLGRRARELAGSPSSADRDQERTLTDDLAAAVTGADPTEVLSLSDALDDPGDGGYSPEALDRFAQASAELRSLRGHVGEPILDLVRRIVDTTGIDVELASSVSASARARRDNLDLFVKAVSEFRAVDGDVSLPALLAYLEAEDESGGNGLDVATPTEADSVKLLTVHRAKGLEWDAVFVVGVSDGRFPTDRTRTKWTAGPAVLPYPLRGDRRDLPELRGWTKPDLDDFAAASKVHEAAEELRLGYVAFTRARHLLVVSSYLWSRTRAKPLAPSPYQLTVLGYLTEQGLPGPRWTPPPDGATNPLHRGRETRPWPAEAHTLEVRHRLAAAELVRAEMARRGEPQQGLFELPSVGATLTPEEARLVTTWDREAERLVAEARARHADVVRVAMPSTLSATAVARLRDDPAGLAETLARPMPRQPSSAARFGTRFHAWVEAHYQQHRQLDLVDPDDLPGRADLDITDETALAELVERFRAGPFADRRPVAVEAPFALVLAGQVVRGRIDAVFPSPSPDGDGYLVVDWKTHRSQTADPLQLALYRLAWADLAAVPLDRVRAGFYYVRDGDLVEPPDLPDRTALERLLHLPSTP